MVNEATINRKNISDDLELNSVKDSTVRAEPEDVRIKVSEERLLKIRTAQYEKGLTNRHFITNAENQSAELENPLVLLVESKIDSIRQIQTVLEYVIKNNKPLLIIGDLEQGVLSALARSEERRVGKECRVRW